MKHWKYGSKKSGASLLVIAALAGFTVSALAGGRPGESAPVSPSAQAPLVTFASNLFVESCGTCNYDTTVGGYYVWGPDNCTVPGHPEDFAVPFIPAVTGKPTRISVPVILSDATRCPTNRVTILVGGRGVSLRRR